MASDTTNNRPQRTPHRTPKRRAAGTTSAKRKSAARRKTARRGKARARTQWRVLALRCALVAAAGLLCYLVYIYFVMPYSLKWQALYGRETYPEGFSIHGIDVSHHQGQIDWDKAARSTIGGEPVSFVFIKATEGTTHLDENFNNNFYQAREHGLLRGAYHYFKPSLPAKEQAEHFLRQVHLEEGDLPPVLDIEEAGQLSTKALRAAALTWLNTVERRYGTPPILYTGYKFRQKYLDTPEFQKYPYWIAHYYIHTLRYKGKWHFWQHTDKGRIDGIKEDVDLNIYNGSMHNLRRLTITGSDDGDDNKED